MIKNVSIKTKLLGAFLLIGVFSIFIRGWLGFNNSRKTIEETTFERLTAIRET